MLKALYTQRIKRITTLDEVKKYQISITNEIDYLMREMIALSELAAKIEEDRTHLKVEMASKGVPND